MAECMGRIDSIDWSMIVTVVTQNSTYTHCAHADAGDIPKFHVTLVYQSEIRERWY
jgi:hypothetical protein